MMERRRVLTIPFTVDKDKLVSWTEFASPKQRCDSLHKNGSILFDHNLTAKVTLEMARKKPCLILKDILKTKQGKEYMERIKQSHTSGNEGQLTSMQKKGGLCKEEPLICRDTKSSKRETRNDKNKSTTPKSNQKTSSSPSQRSRLRRRLQSPDEEGDKNEKDIKEVIIGNDCEEEYKYAEVVDCGLSVSWDSTEDTQNCDEFSPASIKEYDLKRKRKDAGSECNGRGSPKRHRESVLRLTGEDRRNGGAAITCPEESGEDEDLESLDRSIVQFTVGRDDPAEVLNTIIRTNMEARDSPGTPRQSLLSSQDNTTKTRPPEPIVLSSDDEESCDVPHGCSPTIHALVSVEDTVIQRQPSQEAVTEQQEDSDILDMEVLRVEDLAPGTVSFIPRFTCLQGTAVAFSTLHCGGYKGKSNGDIMIADKDIIIPLKDTSERVEMILTFERKELRRYSIWEQEELQAGELLFYDDKESLPPAVLLFCVSETAAAAVHRDLFQLCVKQDKNKNTDNVSPFILLTLKDHLQGMEGAVLRSLLDIDCLQSLADEKSVVSKEADRGIGLDDFDAPALSLDESIELIRRTGLDPHLLSVLGLEDNDPGFETDQDSPQFDVDNNTTPVIQLEVDSEKETKLELKSSAETETETQLKPEENQEEQELEKSTEKKKDEPTSIYTLCHRRNKGSYSVSLCKPDSSWTKFKHQGLAHRLIQFPPPPLKGGITVTMEDLQCLDSGQFLNDVIIDFYLKYLLQKASAAVTERSHIFSSFFYKQLTRRDNASEGSTKDSCQRQRRHQRVKTWTRHVDIFKKDFLFVPVNQEAHWYLVVICFPGLLEPQFEAWDGPNSETEKSHSGTDELQDQDAAQGSKSPCDNTEAAPTPPTLNHRLEDREDTEPENAQEESAKDPKPGPVSCTEQTYKKKTVCKRPCILVMDSLKRSLHERVFKLLRDYLESEWEVRRGTSRDFGPDQMQSSHCKVPLQDNCSDCGLYLLQYVESFLQDPVVHFDLPLHLERWFLRQQVRRKRDEIRDLVLNLYRHQNLDNNT